MARYKRRSTGPVLCPRCTPEDQEPDKHIRQGARCDGCGATKIKPGFDWRDWKRLTGIQALGNSVAVGERMRTKTLDKVKRR